MYRHESAETLGPTAGFPQNVIVSLGKMKVCTIVAGGSRLIRAGRPPPLLQSESSTEALAETLGVSGA